MVSRDCCAHGISLEHKCQWCEEELFREACVKYARGQLTFEQLRAVDPLGESMARAAEMVAAQHLARHKQEMFWKGWNSATNLFFLWWGRLVLPVVLVVFVTAVHMHGEVDGWSIGLWALIMSALLAWWVTLFTLEWGKS